jgi:hypothetical protein
MKIRDDRRRAVGQKSARICPGQEVKPFEVKVAVNETRRHIQSGEINDFGRGHGAKRKDLAVFDCKVLSFDGLSKRIDYRSVP